MNYPWPQWRLSSFLIKFRNAHDHRRIVHALLLVSLFVGLAKVLGAAKEVAVAAAYGTSPIVDAYVFLFNILSWPGAVLSSVLLSVLVPFVVRQKLDGPLGLALFKQELLATMLLSGMLMAFLAYAAMWELLHLGASGLPQGTVPLAEAMLPFLVFLIPFGFVAGLLAANLMAHHRHTNTLLEGVPALIIFVLVLFISRHSSLQLAWATLAGLVVQLILLMVAQPRGQRLPRLAFSWRAPEWRTLLQGFGIVMVGQAIASVTGVVDQVMVAPLGGGANATLGYAGRVIALFLGLGATAIGRALLPALTEIGTLGRARAARVASRWTAALFSAGVAVALCAYILAPVGIKLLFERGAFTAVDTATVTSIFRYGVFQLPFYYAGIVVVQLIASRNDYRKFIYIGVINLVTKVVGNLIFIPLLGVGGVMVSTSLMYAVSFPTLWIFARK